MLTTQFNQKMLSIDEQLIKAEPFFRDNFSNR